MSKKKTVEEPESNFVKDNLTTRLAELWATGRSVVHVVSDEIAQVERRAKTAGVVLTERAKTKPDGKPVRVVVQDRWSGFRMGLPNIPSCMNKTNILGTALQMAMMTKEELEKRHPGCLDSNDVNCLPFDPTDDIIFVFESVDVEIKDQAGTLTLIRSIIASNATSSDYIKNKKNGVRGDRMIVLVTTSINMPEAIPELKPEIMPLPSYADLKTIAVNFFAPMWEDFSNGKEGMEQPEDKEMDAIVNSMCGLSAQDAEEAVALASQRCSVIANRSIVDLDQFLQVIEDEKGRAIAKIPGLRYLPKSEIVDHVPPGYEALAQFLDDRMSISTEDAARYHVKAAPSIAIGGAPGLAKTEVAKFVARRQQRTALVVSMGEMKGGLVGSSEANVRRGLQVGRAINATMIWDDVDKGQLGGGSRGYNGDGGTSSGMTQLLLTEMSDPTSTINHVFTFNRVPDFQEILRPGRMDKLIKVVRPNAPTRLAIFKDHVNRWNMTVDDEDQLKVLADNAEGWTGAEIAHVLVKEEGIKCLSEKKKVMSVKRMTTRASTFTPMSKMKVFAQDLATMEEATAQFEEMGNIPDSQAVSAAETGESRARRVTR